MTPVMQTVMPGEGRVGDCLRACLASILNLPCERVPHYMTLDDWRARYNSWLEQEHGLSLLEMNYENGLGGVYPLPARTYLIVAGHTSRHPDRLHAVVAQTFGDYTWRYVHDPHPDGTFLKRPARLFFLVCTDPSLRR